MTLTKKVHELKLFSSPIFIVEAMPEESSVIKNGFLWALMLEENSCSVSKSNQGGFQSEASTKFDALPSELFKLIKRKLEFLARFHFGHWWININRQGDFNQLHSHPISDISVVYYLSSSKSAIVFQHPSYHSRWLYNQATGSNHFEKIMAKEGDMIVFPADLQHYVEPNQTEDPRISIAINLNFSNLKTKT